MRVVRCDRCGCEEDVALLRIRLEWGRKRVAYSTVGHLCNKCREELERLLKDFLSR